MLSRTDSGGKTGTDLSETSTCTTEDYVTANDTNNSGTDTSSRRSLAHAVGVPSVGGTVGSIGAGDGSSFESASSIYSLAREMTEDLIQVIEFTVMFCDMQRFYFTLWQQKVLVQYCPYLMNNVYPL